MYGHAGLSLRLDLQESQAISDESLRKETEYGWKLLYLQVTQNEMNMETVKCLIVGGGPAGYTAAIMLRERIFRLWFMRVCSREVSLQLLLI